MSLLSASNPALNSGNEPLFSSPPLGCNNANSLVSFAYEQTIQGLRLLTFSDCIEIQPVAFSPSAEFSFKCVSRLKAAQTHRSQTDIPGAAPLLKTELLLKCPYLALLAKIVSSLETSIMYLRTLCQWCLVCTLSLK